MAPDIHPFPRERMAHMVGFDLTEEQQALQQTARKFARAEIVPVAPRLDEAEEFPRAICEKAFALGLMNLVVPTDHGGPGLSHLEQVLIAEEMAAGCVGVATTLIANDLAMLPIVLGGTDDQKKRLLTPFTEKLRFTSFCLTEPGAGSDVAGMATLARKEGEEYVLEGSKCFITNGGVAEQYTVFATLDRQKGHKGIACFVVEGRPSGLSVAKKENKMGQRCSNTVALHFDGVRVPAKNRIGAEGEGFKIAMATLDNSRPLTAIFAVGIARAAMEHAIAYAKERKQFGKPIAEQQAIQFMIADMASDVEAARLLSYEAAWQLDAGKRNTLVSSYAKRFAADTAMRVTTDAVQVFGGYGYMRDYPVEKLMRDAKLIQVYEGTSQIQRVVIAKELFARGAA
jgi:acyl-CoA dehydrogenase